MISKQQEIGDTQSNIYNLQVVILTQCWASESPVEFPKKENAWFLNQINQNLLEETKTCMQSERCRYKPLAKNNCFRAYLHILLKNKTVKSTIQSRFSGHRPGR